MYQHPSLYHFTMILAFLKDYVPTFPVLIEQAVNIGTQGITETREGWCGNDTTMVVWDLEVMDMWLFTSSIGTNQKYNKFNTIKLTI